MSTLGAIGVPAGFRPEEGGKSALLAQARGALVNASQLLAEGDDPAPIVPGVIDDRGTTGAALLAMIDRGVKGVVGAGLDAASAKAAAMVAR